MYDKKLTSIGPGFLLVQVLTLVLIAERGEVFLPLLLELGHVLFVIEFVRVDL